ncbi:MAG: tyrosine-type recombinase/integrase [Planctomycetales bacterium]|nr:tyrosine-type recombinase/integrase [Planctomycetales bacterium]
MDQVTGFSATSVVATPSVKEVGKHSRRREWGSIIRRRRKDGRPGNWYVRYTDGAGRERWECAGASRSLAVSLLASRRLAIATESVLGVKPVEPVSLADFLKVYEPTLGNRHGPATVASEVPRLRVAAKFLGGKPLSEVGPGDVADFLAHVRDARGASVPTLNRYAAALSTCFKAALERGYMRDNPARAVKRPSEPARAVPFLTREDLARIVAAIPEGPVSAAVGLLAETGARRGEILALRWADVSLARREILVRRSKNGRPRAIPATPGALAILGRLSAARGPARVGGEDPVLPGLKPDTLSAGFRRAADRLKFDGLRLHDLRHHVGAHLAASGASPAAIASVLGHKTLSMSLRYSRALPAGTERCVMDALAERWGEAPSGEPERRAAEGA